MSMHRCLHCAASTHDQEVFSFYPENQPCNGFEEALGRYKELIPNVRLAGQYDAIPFLNVGDSQLNQGA